MRTAGIAVVVTCVVVLSGLTIPASEHGSLFAQAAASSNPCTSSISGTNDPDYARAELNPTSTLTFNSEDWFFYDCIPQSAPNAVDSEGASGMSENKAWTAYGMGRSDVTITYIEGGVNWRLDQTRDLRRKTYLNCGELPAPENADGSTAKGHSPGCLEPTKSYDLDGDGVLTVDDYANDPRVPRPFLHPDTGGITSEDLIVAFSDGKDHDHNGYVNDISGWNFHRDTNDPQTDNSVYGHSDGESAQAVAEPNNNFSSVGICPNCRLLSVKAGDEAIDRSDRIAEAIAFAVDSGAKVIDVTSATLGQSASMVGAVQYAYDHGVVVAWASNDFESADHTEGMRLAHVWPGNSIVSDQSNRGGSSSPSDRNAVTFRSRSSLTSYGPHSLFSVPNGDGSTSTGIPTQAGVAAMVISAGLDAVDAGQISSPLDANEVMQVVRSTASPIDYTPCPTCFPGLPGAEFNIQYGYGRPNIFKAMQAVHTGMIPPTADITAPDWYQEVDPTVSSSLQVTANVAAKRAGTYSWQVQYGLGPQPLDTAFTTIASGSGKGKGLSAVKGNLDLSQIPSSFWSGDYTAPTADRLSIEQYDVTIRVVVTDNRGLVGEDRRVFHLRHNDTELAGYPRYFGTSLEVGVTMADIEGRGYLDMIFAGSDGSVHAIRPSGVEAPGFPVFTRLARGVDPAYQYNYLKAAAWRSKKIPRPYDAVAGPLAVGDLDHNGKLYIVAPTGDGWVYAWDGLGRIKSGFPVATDRSVARQSVPPPDTPNSYNPMTGSAGGASLGDLEGNGKLDIVVAAWDGKIYAWRPDGTLVPGWPVDVVDIPADDIPDTGTYTHDPKIVNTPTLVDIDGDGHPDVFVGLQDTVQGAEATNFVTAVSSTGQILPNFPVQLLTLQQAYGSATDFITIGVQTAVSLTGPSGPIGYATPELGPGYLIDFADNNLTTMEALAFVPSEGPLQPSSPVVHFTSSAQIGNLLGGDTPQIVNAGVAGFDLLNALTNTPGLGIRVRTSLTAFDAITGENLPQYTQDLQGLPFLSAPALADITGDGIPDIILGTDSSAVFAFDGVTGQQIPGWPLWTGGWTAATPAVGDISGNGKVIVAFTTREGYLRVFGTLGLSFANHEAWHWHQNDRNTGHYGDDTRPPSGINDLSVSFGGASDTLTFHAVGDDWKAGTAASYQVFASGRPITQDNVGSATMIPVDVEPQSSGVLETITVPHQAGTKFYAVRAIDHAGNIGPLPYCPARQNYGRCGRSTAR
ncbi:MAG TPA: FG-GAP-like repeat-containing protein [Candidatus Binataceae bacterium]|nr:FG-GAP-like repeat-containing protein [Candidatus Binataceae bacterium]